MYRSQILRGSGDGRCGVENMMKEIQADLFRYTGKDKRSRIKDWFLRSPELKYMILFRKAQGKKGHRILYQYYKWRLFVMSRKTLIQIPPEVTIGRGFYIGHTGPVIINPRVKIGQNCNIATGVTIGQENRGVRKGTPVIGNKVWIGTNAVIVGNIRIGNDVLIAPNAYVNTDIPDHSIVIGNPAKIIPKENAVQGYINYCV